MYVSLAFFFLTPQRRLNLNFSFAILVFFSLSLIVFNANYQGGIADIIKAFYFPFGYLMGISLFIDEQETDLLSVEKKTRLAIYVVAIGSFVHFCLNMLVNLGRTNRAVIEFWSREELSATGQATFASLIIAVIAATLFSDTSKKKKGFAIAALVLVILYNLILSGRTLFVLIAVALIVAYFYKSYVKKINIIKTCAILVVSVAVLLSLYNANAFKMKTTFERSNFYDRFFGGDVTQDIDEDSRMEHKTYYITHLGDSMFGGGHLREAYGHSAHDLYLDTYDESGIFAALLIIFYILASLIRMIQCLKNKRISLETRQLVLCIYLIVNIMFFMEPIIRGMPWLLFSYCFIDGAIAHLLTNANADTTAFPWGD